ncbi:hypothetical protein [Streptomyces albogriseolus]|uniref:hypothetical protein n=1 Tax=Streptomyces albogriseolus TaxID=1887 RepID=UPI0034608633
MSSLVAMEPGSGRMNLYAMVFRLTPLRAGRPAFDHAVTVNEPSNPWRVTLQGVQADGMRVPVIEQTMGPASAPILGYEAVLSVGAADTPGLRPTVMQMAAHAKKLLEDTAALTGADGWALEAWSPVEHGARFAYFGAPWLTRCKMGLTPLAEPARKDGDISMYRVQVLTGITHPGARPWPAGAPPVLIDPDTQWPRPMRIEDGMHFTVDLTSLAPREG